MAENSSRAERRARAAGSSSTGKSGRGPETAGGRPPGSTAVTGEPAVVGPRVSAGGTGGETTDRARAGFSRRRLIGTAGAAGAAGLALGAAGGVAGHSAAAGAAPTPLTALGSGREEFRGLHQPGITTAMHSCGHLVAFDLTGGAGRKEAAALLRRWSATAERLMAGETAPTAVGADTDVARDAGPSRLTVTFGFGHSFFGRTGLVAARPAALDPLPEFSADRIDGRRSNGDLWVQIGADDSLVAFHALRTLQKEAAGTAKVRWQMNGFNRSPGATAEPMTTRNLMGQVDGTNNPKPAEKDFGARVFVAPSSGASPNGVPAWMAGGSYAVVRRIRMLLDDWEKLDTGRQERVIGRRKKDGAPLTGGAERTEPELEKTDADGELVIPLDAHSRISRPDQNGGAAMLRRPFSFHDGIGDDGTLDAGLLFICWQADPLRGFVPVQRKLDRGDALSRFLRHESSGLYAVPGGAGAGEYVGQRLLEG